MFDTAESPREAPEPPPLPPLIRARRTALVVAAFAVAIPFVLAGPWTLPLGLPAGELFTTLNLALIAALGAAAFNLLLGYTHQISVAHAAFLIVGSIVAAWLGEFAGLSFPLVVIAAGVTGGLVGAIVGLPALRFRGLYLLIATLGVHYIAVIAYQEFQLRYFGFGAVRFSDPLLPTSPSGLIVQPAEGGFAVSGNFRWYWVILTIVTLSILFMANVLRTRHGRAFRAVGEHDVSASLMGVDVTRAKLASFALSSAFVAVAGALTSYYIGARGPESFSFEVVLHFVVMIVVGGTASLQGAVFGAFFFYFTPLVLRLLIDGAPILSDIGYLSAHSGEINLLIFGMLVVIILVRRPEGLAGLWIGLRDRRQRSHG